jgi:uncharacterized protein YkwD
MHCGPTDEPDLLPMLNSLLSSLVALTLTLPWVSAGDPVVRGLQDGEESQVPIPRDGATNWDWVPGSRGDHWYALTSRALSFEQAEGEALVAGGHLVSIESGLEREFLLEAFARKGEEGLSAKSRSLWIGLWRRMGQEKFEWISGASRVVGKWADGEPVGDSESSSYTALITAGPEAGEWEAISSKGQRLFGVIEIEFDPEQDSLRSGKKSAQSRERAWHRAREACLAVADENAEAIDLAGTRDTLAAVRKEQAAIIHARPLPTSAETRAASDTVQEWIELRLGIWSKKSREVRQALANLARAHKILADGRTYPMTERAARVDMFCAMVNRKRGARDRETRARNRRVLLRAGTSAENFAIVAWTNEHRQMMGVGVLALDNRLTYAAQIHADDMSHLGFFAHQSPVPGRTHMSDRGREGGHFQVTGENLHRGGNSGVGSVQAWIGSPGHHSNMLAPSHRSIGPGASGPYTVELFGG